MMRTRGAFFMRRTTRGGTGQRVGTLARPSAPASRLLDGVDVAYLPTGGDLGVILEIFSGMPGAEQEPEANP